jgi:hypothetical protein
MSQGYSVRICDGDNELAYYSAGGHPQDSQAPGESPFRTVRRWAVSTAKEMFAEHAGRQPKAIEIEVETESPDGE